MRYIITLCQAAFIGACSLCAASDAAADVPANYYRAAAGKSGAELKSALHNIIYNHTEISSYQALPDYFRRTDVYPPGNERYGQWWDMYSDIPLYTNSFWGLNREHAFPKSWWGGSTATSAYIDLFHLYPSEQAANMAKSNYPLGEVLTPSFNNGISRVGTAVLGQGGGARAVFEPDDEYKGDFARTYFYMATCYQNLTWSYTYMVSNNSYPTLSDWAAKMLLQWHTEDPVSQKEIDRNETIYRIQANRNPFIDYPELAEYLWGSRKGQIWNPSSTPSGPTGTPVLITPVQDMELQFGETATGTTNTASLFFHGENLTGRLELVITGTDRKYFTLDASSISASAVNADSGYWLKVMYNPTELGTHTARLVISDGGIEGSLGIALRGESLPVPTLHEFRALEATDVSDNSYTANWEVPDDDTVDYYVVTRTVYNGGNSGTEELEAETNQLKITDCTPGSTEVYQVRSVRLGYYSPYSNAITVNLRTDGIESVGTDAPFGWTPIPGGLRVITSQSHTGCRIYDTSGRLVRYLPVIVNDTEIFLPLGAYIITTEQQPAPIKVLIRE